LIDFSKAEALQGNGILKGIEKGRTCLSFSAPFSVRLGSWHQPSRDLTDRRSLRAWRRPVIAVYVSADHPHRYPRQLSVPPSYANKATPWHRSPQYSTRSRLRRHPARAAGARATSSTYSDVGTRRTKQPTDSGNCHRTATTRSLRATGRPRAGPPTWPLGRLLR
jgi:hypothetical protein